MSITRFIVILASLCFVVTAIFVSLPPDPAQSQLPMTGAGGGFGAPTGGGGNTLFSLPTGDSVHFMSPTGSDAANGLTPATAWASPNHALNCGDVIIAAAGDYSASQGFHSFGTVSNCPST